MSVTCVPIFWTTVLPPFSGWKFSSSGCWRKQPVLMRLLYSGVGQVCGQSLMRMCGGGWELVGLVPRQWKFRIPRKVGIKLFQQCVKPQRSITRRTVATAKTWTPIATRYFLRSKSSACLKGRYKPIKRDCTQQQLNTTGRLVSPWMCCNYGALIASLHVEMKLLDP
jgi:hypothetical protein